MDKGMDQWTDGQVDDVWLEKWTDGWIDEQMNDSQMDDADRWIDGWMDNNGCRHMDK